MVSGRPRSKIYAAGNLQYYNICCARESEPSWKMIEKEACQIFFNHYTRTDDQVVAEATSLCRQAPVYPNMLQ